MSDQSPAFPPGAPERTTSGAGKILLGFVIGALFGLAPMYYFYMGREAALRAAQPAADAPVASRAVDSQAPEPPRQGRQPAKAFASRLTYELSHLPEEPVVAKAPVVPTRTAAPQPAEDSAAGRIAHARPITASPPPRDRTASIEQETHKPEYREGARPPAQAAVVPPRVIEGRDVELKPRLPDTPTRPIVAAGATNTRAEIEAERARLAAEVARAWPQGDASKKESRTVVATVPAVASTPIARPAETPRAPDTPTQGKPAAAPDAGGAAASVEGRLAATREWLASAPQTTHTIQLMGTSSEESLKQHLKALTRVLEPGKIYVFRTVAQGRPSITVVYGAYADRQAALQALGKLPAPLVANKPVLRTVNGIRAEMKQHKTGS